MQNNCWKSTAVQVRRALLAAVLAAHALTASAATSYVWQNSPSPAPPYATWASAATNIQDAIDAAAEGDTVSVTNGVYASGIQPGYTEVSNRVVINKAIAVRSVNGPAHTFIVGGPDLTNRFGPGSIRCVYLATGAVLDGFSLTNGHSIVRGGGAWCQTNAVLTNCVLIGNRSNGDGAGVHGGTLFRCEISGNSTQDSIDRDGDGGGADHSTLYNCVVSNNRGRKGGGVDNSTLYGCILIGNNGRVFGGGAARSTLYHCTVVDNKSRRGGGASESTVYNSIVYHNRAAVGPNHAPSTILPNFGAVFDVIFYSSCTTPLPDYGSNNITADPRLASWSHLSSSSPCRGAGSTNFTVGAVDIDGQAFGTPPSMGADELTAGMALASLRPKIETHLTSLAVGFAARFKLEVDGPATGTQWDFGDGTLVTNQLIVSHAWSAPGLYPVRLIAWNDYSGQAGTITTTLVSVITAPTFFVNRDNPAPAFPFDSWATAANDIQSAISVTNVAGRIVWVTNGVYDTGGVAVWGQMTNRVALSNAVVVRSVNGPGFTFLRGAPSPLTLPNGDGAIRCAYVDDEAVLDGFTLTNGYTRTTGHISREQGGGGAWCESRGVVTNCVFTRNTASTDGGGANGGIFFNCTFVANRAFESGGAVDDAVLYDCLLTNNVSQWGGSAASEAQIHRSTVVSNGPMLGPAYAILDSTLRGCVVALNIGGGAYRSDFINCVLNRNDAGFRPCFSSCSFIHCTLYDNFNAGYYAVVEDSRIRNTIIAIEDHVTQTAGVDMQFSMSDSLVPGMGNIVAGPAFVPGSFRLLPGSPGIDAGTNLSPLVSSDFDGLRRPLDGNRDGVAAFDMGAYEFNPLFFTSITKVGSSLRVSWFDSLAGMQLQAAPSLPDPVWANVPFDPGTNSVELPLNSGKRFFRLLAP